MENTITAHTIGQMIDHSFRMALKNYKRFALPVIVYSAITTLLMNYMFASNADFFIAAGSLKPPEEIMAAFHPRSYFLVMIAVLIVSPLFQHTLCDLASSSFFLKEDEWSLSASLNKGINRYVPFLVVTLLSSLIIMAGMFLFLIGSLIAALYLSLVYPVMVNEEGSPRETLRRSLLLIRGEFWKITAAWILFWLIFFGIDLVTTRLLDHVHRFLLGEGAEGALSQALYFVLNAPVVIFTIGFQSCFAVNLYFNQRIKREGFGLEE